MQRTEHVDAAELETIQPGEDTYNQTRSNYAVSLMIVYLLAAIPAYLFCIDVRNRHYVELANRYIPALFFLVCAAIVFLRLTHNRLLFWTPITWFFVTSALLFGMAPLIYFYGTEYSLRYLDAYFVVDDIMLLRTNLLNAVGTLIVCLAHSLGGYFSWRPSGQRYQPHDPVKLARRIFWMLLIVALPLKWFVFVPMYMDLFNIVIPAVIQNIANLMGACITLAFFIAFSGHKRFIWIAVVLMISDALVSTLTFSKTHFILPVIQATIGIYLARSSRAYLILGLIVAILGYMWIKPLVDMGRSEFSHTGKSASSRVEMVGKYLNGEMTQSATIAEANSQHWWTRQSFSNIEAFMINAYDNGTPGDTIRDFWVILIPRVLWPDKPNISMVGANLNKLIVGNDQTSVGGTVYGEAYWNAGWPMVVFVSIFMGALFYILGQHAIYYMEVSDVRYVPIALMGIFYGLDVQDWFILAYVGTIPLIISIWYFIKILVPIRDEQ